jgi:hypothetical protein
MALFAFVTDKCREEAKGFNYLPDLKNLCEQIEESQDFNRFDPFPPPYLVRKHFAGRNGRLIALKQPVTYQDEEHTVIVLLSVIMRGNRAYEEFSENAAEYGARHFAKHFTQSELETFIEIRMASDPVIPKPALSDEEYGYLYEALSSNKDNANDLICESADWEGIVGKESVKPFLTRVYDALGSAKPASTAGGSLIDIPQKPGWKILARSFPSLNTWFLAALLTGSSDEEESVIREKYNIILEAEEVELQILLQHSRRSYPQIILAEEALWQKVQSDKLANLALSPEETQILKTGLRPEGAFPLFINGRAGSGKSTILQYLFADYLFYHIDTAKTGAPPAYFTYSEELLKEARDAVESVLGCSAKYWEYSDQDFHSDQAGDIVAKSFREFRQYLLSLVPEGAGKQRFIQEKYIDYSAFRNNWSRRFGRTTTKRDVSPDLCWHIIRTYVKGTSPDTFLDVDEYCQLEQNHRTVSPDIYNWVYQNVWEKWYKELTSEDSGYWDDQDLVRYVLDNDHIKAVFPCIFCDEAQDFTRVELEAIRRMSLFSDRTVEPQAIAHVPFVFAGDQFQTVNPTGFRWDAIKAWFVEKFIFALDSNRKSALNDINYHELSYNYRSTAPIVGFSNYVQALRGYLFDLPDVEPQIPWDTSPASPVSYFQISQDFFWHELKKLSDVVLILPCHENEEDWFIDNDPVLSEKIRASDGSTLIPVLSPVRAKGREFARVVLYGFGKNCPDKLLEPLRKPDFEGFSQEESLPLEYFLNRLYVAVSRPKQQLMIVDEDSAERSKLWVFANNSNFEEKILAKINVRNVWDQRLNYLENGRIEMLTASNPMDSQENARVFEEDGLRRMDSYILRQAAISYKNCGNNAKANFCRAWEYRIDGEYSAAGNLFLGIGHLDDAIKCYWMAGKKGWPEIVSKCKDAASRIEYQLASFHCDKKEVSEGVRILEKLSTYDFDQLEAIEMYVAFGEAVEEVLRFVLGQSDSKHLVYPALFGYVQKIRLAGITVDGLLFADLAFKAREYEAAIEIWDQQGKTHSKDYKRAKAAIEPYPECLNSFYALQEWSEMVEKYREHHDQPLSDEQRTALAVALARLNNHDEALAQLVESRSIEGLREVEKIAKSAKNQAVVEACRLGALVLLVESGTWLAMPDVINSKLSDKEALTLCRALARSDKLVTILSDNRAGGQIQKQISEFLRNRFIKPQIVELPEQFILEIGAAIERAGNRVDALQFYELIDKGAFPQTIQRQAAQRWVVCKERQAKFNADRGIIDRTNDRMKEAEERRQKLGIADKKLPEFPILPKTLAGLFAEVMKDKAHDVPKVAEKTASEVAASDVSKETAMDASRAAASKTAVGNAPTRKTSKGIASNVTKGAAPKPSDENMKAKTEMTIGSYKISFFRERDRINIEHMDSGEHLSIRNQGTEVEGDWEFDQPEPGHFKIHGAEFDIVNDPEKGVALEFGKNGVVVFFERV